MANKQAKEKHQKRRESSTRLMVSRVDMEEVRTSCSPAQVSARCLSREVSNRDQIKGSLALLPAVDCLRRWDKWSQEVECSFRKHRDDSRTVPPLFQSLLPLGF